jgi:hypothetical protein
VAFLAQLVVIRQRTGRPVDAAPGPFEVVVRHIGLFGLLRR